MIKNFRKTAVLTLIAASLSLLGGCIAVHPDGTRASATEVAEFENSLKRSEAQSESSFVPQGEFSALPTGQTSMIVRSIKEGNENTFNAVLKSPNDFTPPVLMALADRIYEMGDYRAAMFWFYTAQLRARSDANKSLDPSVKDGVTGLSMQFGQRIGEYAKSHLAELHEAMALVLEWDGMSKRRYEPRWVAILGNDAKTETRIRFRPESEWKKIDTDTRDGFEKGYRAMTAN